MLRTAPAVGLASILALSTAALAQPRVPDTTAVYARVDTLDLKLDLYFPNPAAPPDSGAVPDTARRPLIVWFHGGGWRGGSRTDPSPAMALLESGYAVAGIDYRLSTRALWPAQLHDAKAAVRWLRAHADDFRLDTARFAAWGTSAGGHLAAMLGVTAGADGLDGAVGDHPGIASGVRAVVFYHGAGNFLEPIPRRWTRWSSVGQLLGCAVPDCMDRAWLASPVAYATLGDPPFFIAHGTADSTVPFTQSVSLDSTLRAAGISVEFVPLEGAGHGGDAFVSEGTMARIRAFLNRALDRMPPEENAGTPADSPGAEIQKAE